MTIKPRSNHRTKHSTNHSMRLYDCRKGQCVAISAIDAPLDLKQRLNSFGLIKGATLRIDKFSMTKQTLCINIDNTCIALRATEAKVIWVEPCP